MPSGFLFNPYSCGVGFGCAKKFCISKYKLKERFLKFHFLSIRISARLKASSLNSPSVS